MTDSPRLTRRQTVLSAAALAASGNLLSSLDRRATAAAQVEGLEAFMDPTASAEDLTQAWFALLSQASVDRAGVGDAEAIAKSMELVLPWLDPAFQILRATGERYVADTYVPASIGEFSIDDVRETRPAENLVVARYGVRTPGAATADTSMVLSDELAPRLTVFRWDDAAARWLVLSHANFNVPVSTICDAIPLTPALNPPVPTIHDDVLLGISLVEAAAAAAYAGDTTPVLDPNIQVQTAGGYGYTTLAERPGETKLEPGLVENFLVTRHDDTIVVSFRGAANGEVNEIEMNSAEMPRMLTFRLNEEGEWKVIATAYFSTVAGVPEGVDCEAAS